MHHNFHSILGVSLGLVGLSLHLGMSVSIAQLNNGNNANCSSLVACISSSCLGSTAFMVPNSHGVALDQHALPTQPYGIYDSFVMGRGFGFSPHALNSDEH